MQCRVLPFGRRGGNVRLPPLSSLPSRGGALLPAWKGSRTTANRAMRLIAGGALDTRGVEALAARLGIGPRHLSRLFQRHFGASPMQAAKTARIQRAKRLIDATDLPMTEIALRSGFRSLRRFNTVFAEVYQRPPTAIRRARLNSGSMSGTGPDADLYRHKRRVGNRSLAD